MEHEGTKLKELYRKAREDRQKAEVEAQEQEKETEGKPGPIEKVRQAMGLK